MQFLQPTRPLESAHDFAGLFKNIQLAVVMLGCDARITYCNAYLLRLTGWQLDEVVGRDWFEVFMPVAPGDDMRPVFAQLLADLPEAWVRDHDTLTRAGERRLIRWNNSVLRAPSGEVVGTASIGEDITERRQAEQVLLQRAAELERFHRLSVGRELQMIELKKRVNAMSVQAGVAPPYDLSFLGAAAAA
jgi:PAS domain S-box-containing protein